jgi:hypothetical protein
MGTVEKLTHWKKLHNPNYIGTYAFQPNERKVLTIKSTYQEDVHSPDGKTETCQVVSFVEDEKPLIVNKTNAESIEKVAGSPYVEYWTKTQIELFVTKVQAFGKTVDAVRVKPTPPKIEKEKLTPDNPKWDKAKQAVKNEKTTIEKIRKSYELSEENVKLLINEE